MSVNLYPKTHLRETWQTSKRFRRVLIIVLIYFLLRLAAHGVFLADMLVSGETEGYDLQIYLDAVERLEQGKDLYPSDELTEIEFYQYAPAYALAFMPFRWMPLTAVVLIHTLLHLGAFGLLYSWWNRIFKKLHLQRAQRMLAWSLPVWLVFSQFWSDLSYLNIYIFMALLATLLIDALLDERLGWSLLWLAIILQTKPQWAFAAVLPLLLGRRRFFLKLLGGSVLIYVLLIGLTMVVVGPAYGWEQHLDYWRLLWEIRGGNYPWRGPEANYLGYNHSITQTVVYAMGVKPAALWLATLIKGLLLLPLAVVGLRLLRHPPAKPIPARLSLDLAFTLYLGVFIWMDVVWELTLSIAVFTYLAATLARRKLQIPVWVLFLSYALLDFWQFFSFAFFGPDIIVPGPFVLTDPGIYVPVTMIVNLVFYALFMRRLWPLAKQGQT